MNKALDAILKNQYDSLLLYLHIGYSQKDFTRAEMHFYLSDTMSHDEIDAIADEIDGGE